MLKSFLPGACARVDPYCECSPHPILYQESILLCRIYLKMEKRTAGQGSAQRRFKLAILIAFCLVAQGRTLRVELFNIPGIKIMSVSRRHFLKYCAGSATVLGLEFSNLGTLEKVLAAANRPRRPSYPISDVVYTTLDRTVVPTTPNPPYPALLSFSRVSSLNTRHIITEGGLKMMRAFLRDLPSFIRAPTWRPKPSGHRSPIRRWPRCF